MAGSRGEAARYPRDMEREAQTFEPDRPPNPILLFEDDAPVLPDDPGVVMLTCANCGAQMIERKCKLICACGYFLSCSDYY
jgi:hypothetical protein